MNQLPISHILIPEYRMRRTFDEVALQELADDIAKNGLYNPITVRATVDGVYLIAGERRFRALQSLIKDNIDFIHGTETFSDGLVPVVDFGDLYEEDALAIELSENIFRQDLTWQERTQAWAKLHSLRKSQADAHGENYTPTDTAREILHTEGKQGGSAQVVREALRVAEHLADPDVAKARSQKEALKVVEKKTRQFFEAKLAGMLGAQTSVHTLEHTDSLTRLTTLPDGVFDLIMTDPPYGVNAHTFSMQNSSEAATKHVYNDTPEYAFKCYEAVAVEGYRICRPNAHAYVLCDIKNWYKIKEQFQDAGWFVWYVPLIWDKKGTGMLLGDCNGPRHTYEAVLFASKGSRQVSGIYPDILTISSPKATEHAAQKPVELYVDLLRRSCVPGDKVIDPFCGSGTIFGAAAKLSLVATGLEMDEASHNTARLALSAPGVERDEDGL